MTKQQDLKQQALDILRQRYAQQRDDVTAIDERLGEYFDHILAHSGTTAGDTDDLHNVYEVLGAVRFLRLMRTYDFNDKKVRQVIRLREGEWQQDDTGRWKHIKGGLPLPHTSGKRVYRWQPFQVYILASVFGFQTWIDTDVKAGEKDVLEPTEKEENGKVWDFRRLILEYVFFGPRKTDKTGLSAYIQVVFFLMGDYNSEAFCCAMGEQQSKVLFNRTKFMLDELNTDKKFRMTEKIIEWRPNFREVRASSITPMTAGGKMKDGKFAELCNWDELGNSPYTNGKSDMQQLINVIESSMGPRREPLTFGTTSAGTIQTGPFIEQLGIMHRTLEKEVLYDSGEEHPTLTEDRSMCLLLEPDEWEKKDEEYLLTSHALRRKVNPMLGIIVQHQFYDKWVADAKKDPQKMPECKSKLFNVYSSAKAVDWVKPERIRQLQGERRIEQCTLADGWEVYDGMDFSQGNDIHAQTYLAERWSDDGQCEFFADMDAWISEKTLRESSIRDLYELWIKQGWLRVSEGDVFQPNLPVKRIRELDDLGISFVGFGYDPHLSKEPINELKTWLQSIGLDADKIVIPISQTLGAFNPAVDRLTYLLNGNDIKFEFSASPLWPWQFGNAVLEVDNRMGNRKPVKRHPGSDACKVDNVQCLCECFLLEEMLG